MASDWKKTCSTGSFAIVRIAPRHSSCLIHAALFATLSLIAGALAQPSSPPPTIRSLAENSASTNRTITTSGLVLSSLPRQGAIFVLQGESGALIDLGGIAAPPNGQRVEIKGRITPGANTHIKAEEIHPLGDGTIPKAPPIKLDEEPSTAEPWRWREFTGVVRSATKNRTGWILETGSRGRTITVATLRRGRAVTSYVVNALVRFQGVTLPGTAVGAETDKVVLWVDDWQRITVERKPPKRPFDLPRVRIADALGIQPAAMPAGLVRLRGRIEAVTPDLRLADDSGVIQVQSAPNLPPLAEGDLVDALGFLNTDSPTLVNGEFRLLADTTAPLASSGIGPLGSIDWDSLKPLLQTTKAVRALWDDQNPTPRRARLAGVATLVRTNTGDVFISQDGKGLRIAAPNMTAPAAPGDFVTVEGITSLTSQGPALTNASLRRLDRRDLPEAQSVTASSLVAGMHNMNRVEIEGVVRNMTLDPAGLSLKLAYAGRLFQARLPGAAELPARMIDARVLVVGVALTRFDASGRPTPPEILMNSIDDLTTESPGPRSPFKAPAATIDELLSVRGEARITRRNRVIGTVTLSWPDRLHLTDGTGRIEAMLTEPQSFNVGDRVNLLGFLQRTSRGIHLEDATASLLSPGERPAPRTAEASSLLQVENDGERVEVPGTVLGLQRRGNRLSLQLEGDAAPFSAILPSLPQDIAANAALWKGARVAVTGICSIREDEAWGDRSLEVLVNDLSEIRLVKAAPRLSPESLARLVGGLIVVLAVAFGWGALQRLRATRTEARFAKAIEASPVPVAIAERGDFRLLEVNESFLRQFELELDGALGHTLGELGLSPKGEQLARFHADLKQGSSVRALQCSMTSGEGTSLETLITAEPIHYEGSERLLLIYQDVTERQALMQQLRESQKMEAVGRLAAGIAHDFNNLITVVQGNQELLKLNLPQNEANAGLFKASDAASKRIADLTRQLLTFSRKQVMRREPVNPDALIRNAETDLRQTLGPDIRISADLNAPTAPVRADPDMLNQLFVHLARNAREAMPDGGSFSISTTTTSLLADALPDHPDAREGRFLRLLVADTGSGMDKDTLARAFEPFFTTKDVGQGPGLGLSTVFGIVKQHEGWIAAKSEPGKGTEFEILLPIDESATDDRTQRAA